MIILLDFDRVLFDTHTFEDYIVTHASDRHGTVFNEGDLSHMVFNDVIAFLEEYRAGNQLILITYGPIREQKEKIKASGITPYFNELMFTGDQTKAECIAKILQKSTESPVVFIDDRVDWLEETKVRSPEVIIIRMKRKGGKYNFMEMCKDCHEVTNMHELSSLLRTL